MSRLLLGLLFLGLGSPAGAQETGEASLAQAQAVETVAQARNRRARPRGNRVNVQVLVVHAQPGEASIDPELRRWSRHLRHLRYDRFTLLDRTSATLVPDRPQSFSITGGREVTVTLLRRSPENCRLRIQMFRGGRKLVDTTVAVNRNGTFIVAGPRHGEGILVLPITASY